MAKSTFSSRKEGPQRELAHPFFYIRYSFFSSSELEIRYIPETA